MADGDAIEFIPLVPSERDVLFSEYVEQLQRKLRVTYNDLGLPPELLRDDDPNRGSIR